MPKNPLVAIVDDDEAVREALSDLLLLVGLPCRLFDRASAFLADYAPGRFGCLVTDVRMPGMSGLELQACLCALGSSLPVIIITSIDDEDARLRALERGAYAWLAKPVANDELVLHLRSAMGFDDPVAGAIA